MAQAARWIERDEALTRLGVKSQTLYAYVSRHRIAARPDPANPRRSLYAADDVARLTGTTTEAMAGIMLTPDEGLARGIAVSSRLSTVIDGRLIYRGHDAIQWAQTATVEDTARLLWDARDHRPFDGLAPRLDVQHGISPRARMFAALGRRAQEDAGSTGRSRSELLAEAASAMNEVIDAVAGMGPRLQLHQRLGRGWKVLEREQPLIRRALVLSADNALDAATMATRISTGGGASAAAAAMAGLVTLVHSPATRAINAAIAHVQASRRDPVSAASHGMSSDGTVAGFGDAAWPDGDPRAADLIAHANLPADLMTIVEHGQGVSGQSPTLALALALVARKLDLPREGAVDLYLIGRLVGLLGHALDQASNGSPIATRLRYVGPLPGAN